MGRALMAPPWTSDETLRENSDELPITYFRLIIAMMKCHVYVYIYIHINISYIYIYVFAHISIYMYIHSCWSEWMDPTLAILAQAYRT